MKVSPETLIMLFDLLGGAVCWAVCAVCLMVPFFGNVVVCAFVSYTGGILAGARSDTKHWPVVLVVVALAIVAAVGKIWGKLGTVSYLALLVVAIACSTIALQKELNWRRDLSGSVRHRTKAN